MKTKIRIQKGNTSGFGVQYNNLVIDILTPRFKGSRYLEPIGQIMFQSNITAPEDWYGMRFTISTDNVQYIKQMAKIAQHIKDLRSGYDAKPDEIIKLIGGEEHIFFDSEFISKLDDGKVIYKVIKDGGVFEKIVAKDKAEAEKLLAKRNIAGALLSFHKKIEL